MIFNYKHFTFGYSCVTQTFVRINNITFYCLCQHFLQVFFVNFKPILLKNPYHFYGGAWLKILCHSIIFFFYGIYADIIKYIFEKKLTKNFLNNKNISAPSLVYCSNLIYKTQNNIKKMKKNIEYEFFLLSVKFF